MDNLGLQRTTRTESAAEACMRHIDESARLQGSRSSPLFSVLDLIKRMRRDPQVGGQFWLIDDRATEQQPDTPVSAWPLWFSKDARADERPMLYLTQSPTSARLSMLTNQTAQRGIFLNDIESSPSRWAKGAHPWLPMWLASNPQCMPYDPACGDEARVILRGALRELYLKGLTGFCYMTLHDEPGDKLECDRSQAYLGMYPLLREAGGTPQVRLLGAGQVLREVQAAAGLLERDWGVASEIWSCPSYTRLARDAAAVQRQKRRQRRSYLQHCLGGSQLPIIAVTGYAEFVAGQLAGHVSAPFTALGADTLQPGQRPDRHWITYLALQSLARQSVIDAGVLGQALQRYNLG
ncbi:transketolase-like TK C-terminal-containing protein [Pseudomonas sp. NPDC089408]|uniref:transketolase-like TK C-terminal-containing protein n=1 Tax=Pseudomonas sp. NPDC089408 TaxID=3364465 RepID=UPI00380CAF04